MILRPLGLLARQGRAAIHCPVGDREWCRTTDKAWPAVVAPRSVGGLTVHARILDFRAEPP